MGSCMSGNSEGIDGPLYHSLRQGSPLMRKTQHRDREWREVPERQWDKCTVRQGTRRASVPRDRVHNEQVYRETGYTREATHTSSWDKGMELNVHLGDERQDGRKAREHSTYDSAIRSSMAH